jgi:hypothetical protein
MSHPAQPPSDNELRFRVELEDDPIKNAELGSSFSKHDGATTSKSLPLDRKDGSTIEHYEASNSAGYLDFEITSAQPLEDGNALLVLHVAFHPCIGWTFANATITWRFWGIETDGTPSPRVVAHAPRKSYGAVTTERKRLVWGLELPLKVFGPVDAGTKPSVNYETEREAEHSMTITGTPRGTPFKTYVVWTLEQNQSVGAGLPSEVQLATVVEHHGLIKCTVDVKARLSAGLKPGRYLRSKSGASGASAIYLDPAKLQGRLQEFKIGWGTEETYNKLLADWTGEVDGAVVMFDQPVAHP